jgi:hypothetical protein
LEIYRIYRIYQKNCQNLSNLSKNYSTHSTPKATTLWSTLYTKNINSIFSRVIHGTTSAHSIKAARSTSSWAAN